MNLEKIKIIVEQGVAIFLGFSLLFLFIAFLSRAIKFRFFSKNLDKFNTEEDLILELQKGLHLISSITTNSVYIGLFGTVVGILITLQSVNLDKTKLVANLALPLISTAAAIIVAIVGNFIVNYLEEYANRVLILYKKEAKNLTK
jgi:biopolymer transport protein ExbB/TolQ